MLPKLRKDCPLEVFNHSYLMDNLKGYANPRGKVGRMLAAGEIIRVKKGLYVFGDLYRNAPVNRIVLANLIYGPSYVSGLFALSYYGLIPERVDTVTSMTTGRNKMFTTPFGTFEYLHLNSQRFTVGIDWRSLGEIERGLLASPEKALADVMARERDLTTRSALIAHLLENLRIDEEMLRELDHSRIARIAEAYGSPTIRLLHESLLRLT